METLTLHLNLCLTLSLSSLLLENLREKEGEYLDPWGVFGFRGFDSRSRLDRVWTFCLFSTPGSRCTGRQPTESRLVPRSRSRLSPDKICIPPRPSSLPSSILSTFEPSIYRLSCGDKSWRGLLIAGKNAPIDTEQQLVSDHFYLILCA